MITEDYVSFETAKLLKEKGFDGVCQTAYETITKEHEVEQCSPSSWGKLNQVKRPTIQMAMKWLKEAHDIFISPRIEVSRNEEETGIHQYGQPAYYVIITYVLNGNTLPYQGWVYEKQEEACEAAIKYCLENLI